MPPVEEPERPARVGAGPNRTIRELLLDGSFDYGVTLRRKNEISYKFAIYLKMDFYPIHFLVNFFIIKVRKLYLYLFNNLYLLTYSRS